MKCPNCKSIEIRKHGFYRGKQRYQCKSCNRQFVDNPSVYLAPEASTGVEERIDRYIRSISTPSTDLLLDLQRATADYPLAKMQPTLAQVEFIALSIQSMGAIRVLEAGIFSGYSTLSMALAMPAHGRLISCGVAGAHLDVARTHWEQAGVTDRIDLQVGSGLEAIDRLLTVDPVETFDLITIGGLKHQYPLYYRRAIELLRPNGLLIATDVLWQGRVLNPDGYNDEFTRGIDLFNRELVEDPRVRVTVLPIGDGISIALKL
jgi:predicted O-methyltransferase YrrM